MCVFVCSNSSWINLSRFLCNLQPLCQIVRLKVYYVVSEDKRICGHCSRFWRQRLLLMDNTTDSPVLPVQTQTELYFSALIMHVTKPGEKKKKEGEVGGVLKARRGVFLNAPFPDRKPISSASR